MVNNNDILKNVLLKMNYNPSKTLKENIEEQSMGGMMTPQYMSDPENIKDLGAFIKEYRHGLMDVAAVGSYFIPVVGPLLSIGFELANSGMYYAEGDDYSAGFSLAFALIPGGELIAKIPAIKKLGNQGLKNLIKKSKLQNAKFTKSEIEALDQINKNKKWITKTAASNASKLLVKSTLKKLTLPQIVRGIYYISLKHPTKFNLVKTGIQIGGIWYSFDKLAEIYGLKNKEDKSTDNKPTYKSKTKIVTDFDTVWDYKMDGDNFYAKKKDDDKWILSKGNTKKSIKEKVFKIRPSKEQIELEKLYMDNKEEIDNKIAESLTGGLTDEQKNIEFEKAWGDFKFE
jgi:hypothetical protein